MRVSVKYLATGTLSNLVSKKVDKARRAISLSLAALWSEKVSSSSLSERARRRYRDAIVPYAPPRAGAYISDKIAVLLERGWKAFDTKPGLLAGRKSRAIPLLGGMRSVGQTSSKGSWKHPGYAGAKVAHRVEQGAAKVIKEVLKRVR